MKNVSSSFIIRKNVRIERSVCSTKSRNVGNGKTLSVLAPCKRQLVAVCRYRDASTVRCAIGNWRYIEIKDDEAVVKATSLPAGSLIIIISSHATRGNALKLVQRKSEMMMIEIASAVTYIKKAYII